MICKSQLLVAFELHGRFGPACLQGHLLIVDVQKHWRGSITVLQPEDNVLPARRPRRRQFNLGGLADTA
jgi:hypothetical protein